MSHERHLCETCLQKEYADFAHACVHESMVKNDVWLHRYSIDDWPQWHWSRENSQLLFPQDGLAKVICDVRIVGTAQGDSWEWAWGNENLDQIHREYIEAIRLFGEDKDWAKLTDLFLVSDEYTGWECASIAHHILGGEAVYRFPYDDVEDPRDFVYLLVLHSEFVN